MIDVCQTQQDQAWLLRKDGAGYKGTIDTSVAEKLTITNWQEMCQIRIQIHSADFPAASSDKFWDFALATLSLIFVLTQSSIFFFSSGSGSIIFMVSGCLLYGSVEQVKRSEERKLSAMYYWICSLECRESRRAIRIDWFYCCDAPVSSLRRCCAMVLRSTTMLLVGSRTGSLQGVKCKGKSCKIN